MGAEEDKIIQALTLPGQELPNKVSVQASYEDEEEISNRVKMESEMALPRFPHTDLGNAERLVYWHGQDVKYCGTWKAWLYWAGSHWKLDDKGYVARRAKSTARQMQLDAQAIEEEGDSEYAEALRKWGRQSESKRRLDAMQSLASTEQGVPVTADEFDCNDMVFNVQNGTIDLATGICSPHKRSELNMKISPVSYDARAQCPTWRAFLLRVLQGDNDLVEWVQRAIGYSLTGSVAEKCFFVLFGTGNNGKSVFSETMRYITGDYGTTADITTFLSRKKDGPRDDLADLHGARWVNSSESERGAKLAEAFVKNITGGDSVKARHLYGSLFEFRPKFKLWLSSNYKPVIGNMDDGIWSRVRLVPFEVTIPKKERDPHLRSKLLRESSGILNWCLEGCLKWQKDGLGDTRLVSQATADYRQEMDILSTFVEECCVVKDDARTLKSEVYAIYKWWAERQGMKRPYTKKTILDMLFERGFAHGKCKDSGPYRDKQVVYGLEVKMVPD